MKPSIQYRSVNTHTLKGLQAAERLKARGWIILRSGLFMVYFQKKIIQKKRGSK